MSKVINILTRIEKTELPFEKAAAEQVLKYLVDYKQNNRSGINDQEITLIAEVLKFIESNSGIDLLEIFEKRKV